jgi:hypothetical protein
MRSRLYLLAPGLALILTAFRAAAAQEPSKPASPKELAAITARGRLLAEYDRAAWQATDAVLAQPPEPGTVQRYIARKTEDRWVVVFGRLNDRGDRFLVAARAVQEPRTGKFTVERFSKPREEGGFWAEAATAIATVLSGFNGANRAYNIAVLPAPGGEHYVYLVPAPTKSGVWPLGGDVRFRVSRDGRQIRETRRLHRGVMEVRLQERMAAHFHTHIHSPVEDGRPQDTDVFHVLSRKPAMPEIIATKNFVYEVKPDGAIRFAGFVKDLLAGDKMTPTRPPAPEKP